LAQQATTNGFMQDGANLPVSARTRFFAAGDNRDLRNTAEHELLHAIGYARLYTAFDDRVRDPAVVGGNLDFTSDGTANGTLRMTLVPRTTHVVPTLTVAGTNQGNTIMRPDQVVGQRMGAFERVPLDDAFAWTGRNLDVRITFGNGFTAGQRTTIGNAETASEALFGSNASGHRFAWNVLSLPNPPREGERQLPPTGGSYDSLSGSQWTFNSPGGMSLSLENVSVAVPSSPAPIHTPIPAGDLADFQTSLNATGLLTDPVHNLFNDPVQVNLTGAAQTLVFSDPGNIEAEFKTEMLALNLSGSVQTSLGTLPIALHKSPSLGSLGEATLFDSGDGGWLVDSFFDVFTEISLDNGQFVPSDQSLYVGFVPEPGSLSLLLVGALIMLRRTRTVRESLAPN
jgi:hypothetical protein